MRMTRQEYFDLIWDLAPMTAYRARGLAELEAYLAEVWSS